MSVCTGQMDKCTISKNAPAAQWVRDKHLTVFSLYSPRHALTEIDLFVEPPLDFETAYRSALRKEVAPGKFRDA